MVPGDRRPLQSVEETVENWNRYLIGDIKKSGKVEVGNNNHR